MDTLGQILNKQGKTKSVLTKQIEAGLVVEYARDWLVDLWGQDCLADFKVKSLKEASLKIACNNSIMAQELKFQQNKLINDINKKFSYEIVKQLKIEQGKLENRGF